MRIMVDQNEVAPRLKAEPPVNGKCPRCGKEPVRGFGLCGGGYGPYWFCADDEGEDNCTWFYKEQIGATDE